MSSTLYFYPKPEKQKYFPDSVKKEILNRFGGSNNTFELDPGDEYEWFRGLAAGLSGEDKKKVLEFVKLLDDGKTVIVNLVY